MPGRYKISFFACPNSKVHGEAALSLFVFPSLRLLALTPVMTSGNEHAARRLPIPIDWHSDSSPPTPGQGHSTEDEQEYEGSY